MKKIKVLDLFSGIGGFSYGLEKTGGFKTFAFCEQDKTCQQVLKKHWPSTHIFEDVTKFKAGYLKNNFDLICGGFPCQDISVAGKGAGIEGSRSGLWKEFYRLIKEISPRWVIIENVANLRSKGLAVVLKDLWSLGYDAEWDIISARSVGAPHLRERCWIVAYPNSDRPKESLPLQTWHKGKSLQPERAGKIWETYSPYPNDFRFWPSFTTEKEKSEWWAEAASGFGHRWEACPEFCRVDDELSGKLDKPRKERIKQLGNSLVPIIPYIIGKQILFHENNTFCHTD